MENNKVDRIYDYFNDNLNENEKNEVEQELLFSSESNNILNHINVLHKTLPYSDKEVEPPTGMKQRILKSVQNTENNVLPDEEIENEQKSSNIRKKKVFSKVFATITIAAILLLSLIGNGIQYINHKESKKQTESMVNTNDAKTIALKSMNKSKAKGQAYIDKKTNKLMIKTDHIEPTRDNEIYQVWVIKNDKPHAAGAFSPKNNKGMVISDLNDLNIEKNDIIALTLENSPNNKKPKGQMVMASEKV